jgi:FR47-like protein
MAWTLTEDLGEYLAAAGDFLRADPVEHTIELTAVEQLRAAGPGAFGSPGPLFGWWRAGDGPVTATVLLTPPYPLLVSPLPAGAVPLLARALLALRRSPVGVNGEQADSARFATVWAGLTGAGSRVIRHSRLYRLAALTPLDPAPGGAPRVATTADRDLIVSWLTAFATETGDLALPPPGEFDDQLRDGRLMLWEADGVPVSLAGFRRPAAGVARIGPVWTPPRFRRYGYAAAVTAAVSRAVLAAGADSAVLFTDLASEASNALYPRLGYEPVADRLMLGFTPG